MTPLYKEEQEHQEHTHSGPSARDRVGEIIQRTSQKNREVGERLRARQAARPAKEKASPDALSRVWASAWVDTFPEAPCLPWTRKVQGQAKHLVQAIEATGSKPHDVLDWTVRHWALIRNTTFSWMKDNPPPDMPNIGFLLVFRDKIAEAWGKRDRLKEDLKLTGTQRGIRQLTRQGMSYDEAKDEIAAREERGSIRQRTAEAKAELARLERAREAALAQNVRIRGETRIRQRAPMTNAYDEAGGIPALPQGGFEDE